MDVGALLYSALTVALMSSALAAYALGVSMRVSRSTRAKKPTPPSLAESSSELESALAAEKISHQIQKLENRLRMREQRTKPAASDAPPVGASKAALLAHYGFREVGPRFAQHQLELERRAALNGSEK